MVFIMQVLSSMVITMIHRAITTSTADAVLPTRTTGTYKSLNNLADICNSRYEQHTSVGAVKR